MKDKTVLCRLCGERLRVRVAAGARGNGKVQRAGTLRAQEVPPQRSGSGSGSRARAQRVVQNGAGVSSGHGGDPFGMEARVGVESRSAGRLGAFSKLGRDGSAGAQPGATSPQVSGLARKERKRKSEEQQGSSVSEWRKSEFSRVSRCAAPGSEAPALFCGPFRSRGGTLI